ncbi:hypothetical protein KPB2_5367 [Klebsiella pneumoniae Kb677]|nr:hypothetical protein KPB2_5367 [Klebsiella pneumoniae Kb677]
MTAETGVVGQCRSSTGVPVTVARTTTVISHGHVVATVRPPSLDGPVMLGVDRDATGLTWPKRETRPPALAVGKAVYPYTTSPLPSRFTCAAPASLLSPFDVATAFAETVVAGAGASRYMDVGSVALRVRTTTTPTRHMAETPSVPLDADAVVSGAEVVMSSTTCLRVQVGIAGP